LYVCHRYMLNVYGSYDPEVRLVPYNKVGLDLIVKTHNEYLRILEHLRYIHECLHILRSKVTNTRSMLYSRPVGRLADPDKTRHTDSPSLRHCFSQVKVRAL